MPEIVAGGRSAPIKIVSGGQTGADRAALDWAIDHGTAHGGWCPRGRRAEDGAIPARYLLNETPSARYEERTEWNVRDSDGTVIPTCRMPSPAARCAPPSTRTPTPSLACTCPGRPTGAGGGRRGCAASSTRTGLPC